MTGPLDLDRALTLQQLRTFRAVADHMSFSAAAVDLGISQPSVSYQVKELETRLLVTTREIHTASGRHELALESWPAWSRRVRCRPARSAVRARKALEKATVALGAPLEALPWAAEPL